MKRCIEVVIITNLILVSWPGSMSFISHLFSWDVIFAIIVNTYPFLHLSRVLYISSVTLLMASVVVREFKWCNSSDTLVVGRKDGQNCVLLAKEQNECIVFVLGSDFISDTAVFIWQPRSPVCEVEPVWVPRTWPTLGRTLCLIRTRHIRAGLGDRVLLDYAAICLRLYSVTAESVPCI
jgi:hypothetical protein